VEIKLIVIDVDGTLTNGGITYDSTGVEYKTFSVKDGYILKTLPTLGINIVFLTGRSSEIVEKRGKELDVQCILQGVNDKKAELTSYLKQHGIDAENVAYIGDDLNDFAAMKMCCFKACPADAVAEIRNLCDYVSPHNGGQGAVRDICEHILKRCDKWERFCV